jgi:HEAT repeat protein
MPLILSKNSPVDEQGESIPKIDKTNLRDCLRHDDIAVRCAAVRYAGELRETELLALSLQAEQDHSLREMILTTIVRHGGIEGVRPLLDLLRSDDTSLRNAVIEILSGMGEAVVPYIQVLLSDADSDVRIFAINIIFSLYSPRVPDIALQVISSDPHVNVCAAAVDVLAEVGTPDMADALRDVAKRFPDQPFLSFAVRTALKRIG